MIICLSRLTDHFPLDLTMTTTIEKKLMMWTDLPSSMRDDAPLRSNTPVSPAENLNLPSLADLCEEMAANDENAAQGQRKSADSTTGPPQRYSIDDCIRDLTDRQVVEMPVVSDRDGDTLVFIDPPVMHPDHMQVDFELYLRCHQNPIVMKSTKLKAASEVFRAKLEDPTGQYRAIRRRGLVNSLSGNLRYVLDLTPPLEGEDAVYLTATLSCSEGIKLWHLASELWDVSSDLVGGIDEYAPKASAGTVHQPATALEYSPVRHRCAIERVLAAIQGIDAKFNSAVKVWTTSVVAQYFNIRHNFLTDSIVTWLRAEPNFYFFEINPEATLRIAAGFENQDIGRDAFAILVGEEALDAQLRTRGSACAGERSSTFGRRKDELPEAWQDCVNYASKSFVDRNIKDFQHLANSEMRWLDELPTVQRLSAFVHSDLRPIATSVKRWLKDYVRGAICKVLCCDYCQVPSPRLPKAKGEALVPRWDHTTIWTALQPRERLFTRTFWEALRSQEVLGNETNYTFRTEWLSETWSTHPYRCFYMQDVCPCGNLHHEMHTYWLRDIVKTGQKAFDHLRAAGIEVLPRVNDGALSQAQCSRATPPLTWKMSALDISDQSEERLPATKFVNGLQAKARDPETRTPGGDICLDTYTAAIEAPTSDPPSDEYEAPEDFSIWPKGTSIVKDEFVWPNNGLSPKGSQQEVESSQFWRPTTNGTFYQVPTSHVVALRGNDPEKFEKTRYALPDLDPSTFFNLDRFFSEAGRYLKQIANRKLAPSDNSVRQYPYVPNIINTLTSLEDSEWRYLPLWAGGLDDGTGAVYTDDIMETTPDAGFAPGHGVHTTASIPSHVSSDFDTASDVDTGFSFHTSTAVNDGFTDQLHRNRTYAASSAASTDDSMIDIAVENEEEHACRQVEALERKQAAKAQTEVAAAAAKRREEARAREDADDYSDMFTELDEEDGDYDSDATETGNDFEDVNGEVLAEEDEDGIMV